MLSAEKEKYSTLRSQHREKGMALVACNFSLSGQSGSGIKSFAPNMESGASYLIKSMQYAVYMGFTMSC